MGDDRVTMGLHADIRSKAERWIDYGQNTYNFGKNIFDATWGNFDDFTGHAARHMVNDLAGAGIPGEVWNSRNAYRTKYNDVQRAGASAGDAGAVVAAVAIGLGWHQRGYSFFGRTGARLAFGRAVLGSMLIGGAVAGLRNTINNIQDDHHFGGIGAAAGAAIGLIAMRKFRPTPWIAVGGVVAAGTAGWFAGHARKINGGEKEKTPIAPNAKYPGGLLGFTRGAFVHFAEEGPLTQGVSFGNAWEEREAFEKRYQDEERWGGMTGDMIAAGFAGGGSLVVANRVLGRDTSRLQNSRLIKLGNSMSVPSHIVGKLKDLPDLDDIVKGAPGDHLLDETGKKLSSGKVGVKLQEDIVNFFTKRSLKYRGRFPELLYLGGAALAAYTIYEAWDAGENGKSPVANGAASAGIMGGILGLSTLLIATKHPNIRRLPNPVGPGMALATSAAVGAAMMMVRGPVENFIQGAKFMHKEHPVENHAGALSMMTAGGAGGLLVGNHLSGLMKSGTTLRIGAMASGAAIGAGIALAYAPAFFGSD